MEKVAITGQKAPEIIYTRADHTKVHMGLQTWKNAPDSRVLLSDAQRGLLQAVPVHMPAARMQGNAQYQQRNRGIFNRPEEESQQPQRNVTGVPQAVHQWFFLALKSKLEQDK